MSVKDSEMPRTLRREGEEGSRETEAEGGGEVEPWQGESLSEMVSHGAARRRKQPRTRRGMIFRDAAQ